MPAAPRGHRPGPGDHHRADPGRHWGRRPRLRQRARLGHHAERPGRDQRAAPEPWRRRGRRPGQLDESAARSGIGGLGRTRADRHAAGRPGWDVAAQRRLPRTGRAVPALARAGRPPAGQPELRDESERGLRRRQHGTRARPVMTILDRRTRPDVTELIAALPAGLAVRSSAGWPESAADAEVTQLAGFVESNFSPLAVTVAERALDRRPPAAGTTAVALIT